MWCNFRASSGAEEETMVNGFSTSALFKISSDEVATQTPTVFSEIQNGKMVLSIEESLFLLPNEQLMDSSAYLCFGSPIDAMCVAQNGEIVICALADGNIHGVHIKGMPLFNLSIAENDIATNGQRTFIGITQVNGSYFLGCSTGNMYRITNTDEQINDMLLCNANDSNADAQSPNQTICHDATLLKNVSIERVQSKGFAGTIDSFCVIPHDHQPIDGNNYISVFAGKSFVSIQHIAHDVKVKLPEDVQSLKSLYNLDYLVLGLTASGQLCQICPHTMCIFGISDVNYLIDDVVVIENNTEVIELLLLTRPTASGERAMKIVDYPSMKCNYELTVPEFAWLIKQPKSALNMYYLHGIHGGSAAMMQEIEMRIIAETQPDQRLKKLIQKGHLDEAEEFANQYNLSLQPVFEARTRRIVIEIASINKTNMDKLHTKFDELIKFAAQITNNEFLMSLRHIDIADRAIKRTFLEFIVANVKADLTCPEMEEINEQIRRLATLALIDAYDCNWDWQTFVFHSDLQKLVVQTFKTDMAVACLIWKHHSSAIVPFRKDSIVLEMLNAIPSVTPPFDIIMWFRHFVPIVSMVHPQTLTCIVEWCLDKTRSLQYSKHWPEIGLEFITNIFEVFDENQYIFSHIQRHHDANIAKMQLLISALHDLNALSKRFNLTLTLDDYCHGELHDIALRILQRVSLNHLAELTREFLFPLFIKRGMDASDSIVTYVEFLVKNRKSLIHWQERAVVSVQQLHNEGNRIECAWLVLKAAPVPWSPALDPLVAFRKSSHPLALEICSRYELQAINVLKTKYGWPMDATDGLLKLGYRIVKMDLPDMFEDIQVLVATDQNLRPFVNVHCAYELTRTGRIDTATAFVNSLSPEHALECCERALNIMSRLMDSTFENSSNRANYVEFLVGISSKLESQRELLESVLRAHRLQRDFNIKVNIDELQDNAKCEQLLVEGIGNIRERLCTNLDTDIVSNCWNAVVSLADTLRLDRVGAVVQMLRCMANVHFSCAITKWVLELCTADVNSGKHWANLAALLMVQHIESLGDCEHSMSFPLAYHLLQRTVGLSKYTLSDTRRLLNWPRVANEAYSFQEIDRFFSDNQCLNETIVDHIIKKANGTDIKLEVVRRESMSIFEEVVADSTNSRKPIGNAEPIVKCVALAMKMFLTLNVKPKHQLIELMLQFYDPADFGATEDETQEAFIQSLEHLIKSKQFSAAFAIMQHIIDTQSSVQFVIIHPAFAMQFHKKMLRFALSQKEPNFIEIQAVLMSDPRPQECLQYLSSELKSGSQKINYLTLLEQYSMATGSSHEINVSRKVRMSYFYFTELCKVDPSLKSRSDLEFSSISSLLNLMQNKVLDVSFLERMSNDLNWNYQEVLVTQIITIIEKQKLEFNIRLNNQGQEEIVVLTPVEAISQTCKPYINELSHTSALANELIRLMDTINFYFYELYLAVIEMLMYIDRLPIEMEVWRGILLFLKHKMITKRRNRVGQIETDAWLRSQLDVGVVPQIARFRFPFRVIVQEPLKNILDDELCVENCVHWFPLIHLHAAIPHEIDCAQMDSADYFCMSAVKNSISEYKQNASATGDGLAVGGSASEKQLDVWNKHPTNNAFLQSILRLLKHMSDPSRKLFILYFVCSQAPEGADQVEVAYECYRFACDHEEELSQSKRAMDIVVKIKRKYPILKTQHLMHLYGLADNRLFQLVESPRDLINALYNHPSILQTPLTNINKVAHEIAELHALNLREIQIIMLEKWLSDPCEREAENVDETFYEDLNTTVEPEQRETDITCVERIYYIICSWSKEDAVRLLVAYIFADGSSNTGKQLQAFECFMKIVDQYSNDFSDTTFHDIITQEHYVVLKCVHYLKQLGYKFTVDKFMAYDKLTVLKKVWSTHAKSQMAMEVIALICTGYDIYMPQIWNGVLKQMAALNMVDRLSVLVHLLSTKKSLLQIDGLVVAWDCVIWSAFKSINQTKSLEQETILRKGLFAMQSCPLASKLNLVQIATTCVRVNRPHMAAVIIQLGNEDVQKQIVKMVLAANSPTLKNDIIELEGFGIYPMLIKYALTELKL